MTHYFDEKQKSLLRPKIVSYSRDGVEFSFKTGSGVFAKDKVDRGTDVLLTHMRLPDSGRVLDLGCGYGVVGIVVAKRGGYSVVCSDVNERAVKLCRLNGKRNGVELEVVKSDLFSGVEGVFDCVLLNPPYVAGRKLVFQMLVESFEHLHTGGTLQVVARHQKGGKAIRDRMEEIFGTVEDVGRGSGFHLYVSKKKD